MPEKFGIENLKEVFKWAITLGKTVGDDIKDKKFTFAELLGLLPQFLVVQDLLNKKDDIINEAKDLSLDEIKEMAVIVEGVITNAEVVAVIENALNAVVSVIALIEAVKALSEEHGRTFYWDRFPFHQSL